MEIKQGRVFLPFVIEFKIDLIVWKSNSSIWINSTLSRFKIDLIVWKYGTIIRVIKERAGLK